MKAAELKTLIGVVSSFGVTSILVFIVGRIWTIAYFGHFGLPASGMEFTVNDFAFRSLEAMIAIVFGALVAGAAWFLQERLKTWGPRVAAVEFVVAFAFWGWIRLGPLPLTLLAKTSVLGLFGGAALAAALWLTVDVWSGPGTRYRPGQSLAARRLGRLLKWIGLKGVRDDVAMLVVWRVAASVMFLLITFSYVPYLAGHLAALEAKADVKTGQFAAAILEADFDLPPGIASPDDPTRSVPVRVILTRTQNTHVLHSTNCTTIGGLKDPVSFTDVLQPGDPEVCRVFTIPTSRITSIEYLQVEGRAPSNQSALQPIEIGLSEVTTTKSFDGKDASDEKTLRCSKAVEGDKITHFFHSLWYEIRPASDGAVLVRVETKSEENEPEVKSSVGVWAVPDEESIAVETVKGSGETGDACASTMPQKNVVGVVANLTAGMRYLVSVGAFEKDQAGSGEVSVLFVPGGQYLRSSDEDTLPTVETASGRAEVKLEVWELNETDYRLTTPSPAPAFSLRSEETDATFEFVARTPIAPPTLMPTPSPTLTATPTRTPAPTPTGERLAEGCPQDDSSLSEGSLVEPETITATPCTTPTAPPTSTATWSPTPTASATLTPAPLATPEVLIEPSDLYLPLRVVDDSEQVGLSRWRLQPPAGFVGVVKLTSTASPRVIIAFTTDSSAPFGDPCAQVAARRAIEDQPTLATELNYQGIIEVDPELEIVGCVSDAADFDDGISVQIQVEGEALVLRLAGDIIAERLRGIGLNAIVGPCADACIRLFIGSE